MKVVVFLRILPFCLLALVCLPGRAGAQATHRVEIRVPIASTTFAPNVLTIEVGDTVLWETNYVPYLSQFHNVTADNLSFASPSALRLTFSQTFTSPGEYLYHCSRHSAPGQDIEEFENGRIVVQGGNGGSATNLALQRVHAASGIYRPGDAIPIDLTIENAGGNASPAFSVTYYASVEGIIDASDIPLGTDNRPGLGAGNSSSFAGNAVLPASIPYGYYYIGAIINFSDANNYNNVGISDSRVSVEFPINAGLNDAWFNPATPGQGFFIIVFPDIGKMFLAWFTYDVERPAENVTAQLGEPGHRWLTAFGDYAGDTATLDVDISEGGVFDSATPVPTHGSDGTITVTFTDCNTGYVEYDIPSVSKSGVVPIERIALGNVALCVAQLTP